MAAPVNEQIARLELVATRLERIAAKLGKAKGGSADAEDEVEVSEAVLEFQDFLKNEVKAFVDACAGLPYPAKCENPSVMVAKCFDNITAFVALTDTCKKPSGEELQKFCAPAIETIGASNELSGTRKRSLDDFRNHLNVLKEVCGSVIWVSCYAPQLPHQQAQSGLESSDFHLNRILMKQKSPENVIWVKACKAMLKKQVELIKGHFKTGLEWSGQKSVCDAEAPKAEVAAPAEEAAPAPEPAAEAAPKKEAAKPKASGDLFGAINKGGAITGHLKKVKKTDRNKYSGKKVKGTVAGGPKKAKAKKKLPDPKKTKRGKTWFLEYYQEGLITIDSDLLKGLSFGDGIFLSGCLNCQFMIPEGIKVKSICMDGCARVQVQTWDIVSTVEMVNCKNCTLWLNGVVPSVALDKCDSPRVIVMPPCWNQEKQIDILTSNVTAGNVEIPGAEEGADNISLPIPEQFFLRIDKETRTSHTETMEHAG